jgi:hypothetical protein
MSAAGGARSSTPGGDGTGGIMITTARGYNETRVSHVPFPGVVAELVDNNAKFCRGGGF